MSRVNQVVANTNTIVKKIVVGTPIRRVSAIGLPGIVATHGQILVYDSAQGKFIGTNLINQITPLIDSAYISARVDPNLVPEVIVDSNTITRIIDSAYIALRTPAPGIDSAAVQSIIDSSYINARVTATVDSAAVQRIVDSAYINARITATVDSAAVEIIIDSNYISNKFPALNSISINDSNQIVVTKDIIPATSTINLGSFANPFQDIFVSGQSLTIGNLQLSDNGDGTLAIQQIDSTGAIIDAPASYNLSDSDIQSITTFGYSHDNNTLTISRTGETDLTATINAVNDLTVNGTLKGPSNFIIDPTPLDDDGGRVTIKGRLTVTGDEFISNATTFQMPNLKTIALGGNLDSDVDANAAGITVGGANTYLRYQYVGDRWVTNKAFEATNLYGKYMGFESDLGSLSTSNIPEGVNLYFTNARADTRINTVVDDAYVRARQLIPGIDSDAVLALVTGVVDSQYSNTLSALLSDLDSARTLIRGVVDSNYVFARYAAVGGETTSVSVEPSNAFYVYRPSSPTIVLNDSDVNGKVLNYSPTNVDVHVNGLKLVNGIDYSTDAGSTIFLTNSVDSGDVVIIDTSKRQAINFYNSLLDSSQTLTTTNSSQFDIFDKTAYRFVKYTVTASVTVGVTAKYQASELLVTHNDTEAFFTEYGVVQAQDSSLGEIDVAVVGSNVKVKFDPTYVNTTVKFSKVSL